MNEPTTGLRLVTGKDNIMGQSTFREQINRADRRLVVDARLGWPD